MIKLLNYSFTNVASCAGWQVAIVSSSLPAIRGRLVVCVTAPSDKGGAVKRGNHNPACPARHNVCHVVQNRSYILLRHCRILFEPVMQVIHSVIRLQESLAHGAHREPMVIFVFV